jgi:hypothetical protein
MGMSSGAMTVRATISAQRRKVPPISAEISPSGPGNHRPDGPKAGQALTIKLDNSSGADRAEAGKFVRFADDVVALCSNYQQAQLLESCFSEHCKNSGLKINGQKSPGIAIISKSSQEMRTYTHFGYLGCSFDANGLGVPDKVVSRIKGRVSRLVNIYLLQYLKDGFNPNRCSTVAPSYDWGLLGRIYELRRSLYGGGVRGGYLSIYRERRSIAAHEGTNGILLPPR